MRAAVEPGVLNHPPAGATLTPSPVRRRSSFCPGADCLWVELLPDGQVLVSDRPRRGVELIVTPGAWDAFLDGVRAGEFDREALQ